MQNLNLSMLQSIIKQSGSSTTPTPPPQIISQQQQPQQQQLSNIPTSSSDASTSLSITANHEWRFELTTKSTLKLSLMSGTAEIFGTELSKNIVYTFTGSLKSCISTFTGCEISYISSTPLSLEYISEELTSGTYLNLYLALEHERLINAEGNGPRVVVIGSKDSGKTSLCKTLVSYTEKMDKVPILVNLNPRDAQFSLPGNLTATPISDLLNVENINLGETVTTGVSFYKPKQPLVKCFGMEDFKENKKFFELLINQLGETIEKRFKEDDQVRQGGIIVDTPPLNVSDWEIIQNIVDSFKINVIVVVGNERLLVDLKKKLKYDKSNLKMVKINRSSGCVENDDKFQREIQQRCIKEYFYGIEKSQLSPYTLTVIIKDFIYLKPKELENLNLSFLSGDAADEDFEMGKKYVNYRDMMERVRCPDSTNLTNSILALIDDSGVDVHKYLTSADDVAMNINLITEATKRSVLGFCYVLNCDDESGKLRLLVPSPVQVLPSKIMILTQFRYHE